MKKTSIITGQFLSLTLLPQVALAHDPAGLIMVILALSLGVHLAVSLFLTGLATWVYRNCVRSKWRFFLLVLAATLLLNAVVAVLVLLTPFLGDGLTLFAYLAIAPLVTMICARPIARWQRIPSL